MPRSLIKATLVAAGLIVLWLPMYPAQVVPEWELLLVDQGGEPASFVRVEQAWKDYSLEFWRSDEHVDDANRSGSDGSLNLPARTIRVSIGQLVLAKVRDIFARINPHASYGPHSYILCRDATSCHATFTGGSEFRTRIVVKR